MVSESKQMKKNPNKKTVHAKKRTYFINQTSIKEESIIEITESKKITANQFNRRTILIYEDDLEVVIDMLQKVQDEIKDRE